MVNVRVRFFLGGGPSGALSEGEGLLGPPSISVSAMSPWEDDAEGLERSRFLLREDDSGSDADAGALLVEASMRDVEAEAEPEGMGCEAMWLEGKAPGVDWGSVGCVRLEGEREGVRRDAVRRCSSGGLLGAEDGASAALRDMFIETKSERLQIGRGKQVRCVN